MCAWTQQKDRCQLQHQQTNAAALIPSNALHHRQLACCLPAVHQLRQQHINVDVSCTRAKENLVRSWFLHRRKQHGALVLHPLQAAHLQMSAAPKHRTN